MKKILSIFLCLVILSLTLASCGTPDIEEIRGRMEELIEASYGVNVLLFGEGPATYERVYDPKASMQYYEAEVLLLKSRTCESSRGIYGAR